MTLSLNIRKRYPGFLLDVQIEAGNERVALLGASGCGKSCTLRCIAGVDTPDEGYIVVNGVTYFDAKRGINLSPQQRKCALLFQNFRLFPHISVLDNVRAGMDARWRRAEQSQRARQYLAAFGIDDLAERFCGQLSGGQQQRVALARMFAAQPNIYMLDEPFSALDSYLKSALEQTMLDAFSTLHTTVLYVSHDIDEACRLCNRIAVVHAGHVVEYGDVDQVINNPQTLAGLRITGCKNTSPARRVGSTTVEATDWGMVFDVGYTVPSQVRWLGVRASYFHTERTRSVSDPLVRNSYDLRVARVSDARFERLVLLDPPRSDAPGRLQWKISKVGRSADELPREGDILRMHFDARRIHLIGDEKRR